MQDVAVPRLCNSAQGLKASGNFLLCIKNKLLWRQTENKPRTYNGSNLPTFSQLLNSKWMEHTLHGGAINHDHPIIFSAKKKKIKGNGMWKTPMCSFTVNHLLRNKYRHHIDLKCLLKGSVCDNSQGLISQFSLRSSEEETQEPRSPLFDTSSVY